MSSRQLVPLRPDAVVAIAVNGSDGAARETNSNCNPHSVTTATALVALQRP